MKTATTVDEIALGLLKDLVQEHINTLKNMTDEQLSAMCDNVRPYLEEEFNVWCNAPLLDSCSKINEGTSDPAMIIFKRMVKLLKNGITFQISV